MTDITLKTRVERLEYWRNGNGTKGAAEKIEDHDNRITCIEKHHEREEMIIVKAVHKAMREHSRSANGIIKTLAPYVAVVSWVIYSFIKGV